MRIPTIIGVIDRRILLNYRVAPSSLEVLLPPPFHPKLVNGMGVAGVCLLRLRDIRPLATPAALGVSSENAAHRIAVEWQEDGVLRDGVYIPRRDSSSRLNTFLGGRLFPGTHHHACFHVAEHDRHYQVELESDDHETRVVVAGRLASTLPPTSIFGSLQEASDFFARGSLGYSPSRRPGTFDGLELRSSSWKVEPLAVDRAESSFFEDRNVFPEGSAELDCALLMRNIEHEWHARQSPCGESTAPLR